MDLEEIGSRIFWASLGLLIALVVLRVLLTLGQRLPNPFGGVFATAESAAGLDS